MSNLNATRPTYRKVIRITLSLLFGFVLLWLVYRHMDFHKITEALANQVNYGVIAFSLLFGLLANCIRGLRWQLLIEPLDKPSPKKYNAVLTTLGTYTVNMAIPRAGEFWRCAEESRYEKLSFTKLLGTLFMDRLTDVLVVGLIIFGVILGAGNFFLDFFQDNATHFDVGWIKRLLASPWLYLGLVAFAILLYIGYVKFKHTKGVQKLVDITRKIIEGVLSIWKMKHKWRFLLYTLLLWIGYFLFFYTTYFAFDFMADMSLGSAIVAFTMGSIAMAVPVQAGMGAWHFMIINTLIAYGITRNDAATFALVVHTIQTLWISFVGLIAILLLPILNKNYIRTASSDLSECHK